MLLLHLIDLILQKARILSFRFKLRFHFEHLLLHLREKLRFVIKNVTKVENLFPEAGLRDRLVFR